MNRIRFPALVSFLIISIYPQVGLGQPGRAEKIDLLVREFAKAKQFSGVVLASENGTVIYEKSFGFANADYKIPCQLNTRIGIASITKLMTIVILNRLIEDGKISPDDKLAKYIPDFPGGDKITIEMLSRHRSGIPHRVMPPEAESISHTTAEFVEKVKQVPLAFEPGTQRLYSSAGYAMLARVFEIASGKSYAHLLQDYVFAPAGMKDSLDFDSETIMERRAQDYLLGPNGYINAPLKDYSFLVGAGSVFSTAADVHRFAQAILYGKYGEQTKNFLIDETTLSGSGSTNGHRAYFEIEREKKYGSVMLSNLASGAFDMIVEGLREILQGKKLSRKNIPAPKIIPDPNEDLTEFFGRYKRSGSGSEFVVLLKKDFLHAGDIRLYPIKKDCFFDYKYFGEVCFLRDKSAKIKEIRWASPGIESIWVKQ
ncbi:beta-lactamase family protein [bacterium]|nr:beta-lactamase family protein [bacterium]